MEEYIKKLLEQVRFEKAHKSIADELRAHIEDQIEANVAEGMDKETAEKKAVADMGDPVSAGVELDKVHRPQLAWELVSATLIVIAIGVIIHIMLSGSLGETMHKYMDDEYLRRFQDLQKTECLKYILYSFAGIVTMLLIYFWDYTTVAKYSKVAGTVLLIAYLCGFWFIEKSGHAHVGLPRFLVGNNFVPIGLIWKESLSLLLLMIPLYAGIIYNYRGQAHGGLIRALIWIIVPCVMLFLDYEWFKAVMLEIGLLAELTIAIKKEWIKVPKIPVLSILWGASAFFPIFVIDKIYKYTPLASYLVNEGSANILESKPVLPYGSRARSAIIITKYSNCHKTGILDCVTGMAGIIIGLLVITLVSGLIVFGVRTVAKTKNQLGFVMGSGCMTWLMLNVIFNTGVGFGILRPDSELFLPFISNNNIIVSYASLGIILSIYKYKNAYAEHIDIEKVGFRAIFKNLEL